MKLISHEKRHSSVSLPAQLVSIAARGWWLPPWAVCPGRTFLSLQKLRLDITVVGEMTAPRKQAGRPFLLLHNVVYVEALQIACEERSAVRGRGPPPAPADNYVERGKRRAISSQVPVLHACLACFIAGWIYTLHLP